jgi:hypothetical protein
MKKTINSLLAATISVVLLGTSATALAGEGRYQAYWNGKSYMILDTDHGHIWNYYGDSIQYNGRIDADEFVSPEKAKIWQQSHGTWKQK